MTEPNAAYLDGKTPSVRLAGQQWPIPTLSPAQLQVIFPMVLELAPKMAHAAALGEEAYVGFMAREVFPAAVRCVHAALARAHPELTLKEFSDMPVSLDELGQAFTTVAQMIGQSAAAGAQARAATATRH